MAIKGYLREVNDLKQAVKDGYCTEETYNKRLSVYNSQLTPDQYKEVKQLGIYEGSKQQ
jgi:hypothetical protein